MRKMIAGLALILMLASLSWAADKSSPFFPLEDVKPGMKAVGRTIFEGGRTEEFGVEILGVLQGLTSSPKRAVIIMRLTGPLTDRSGVFAGMSGSPVFIDGKLLGAVAYSFPFSKEPIGAITPIQDMISVFDEEKENLNQRQGSSGISFKELAAASRSHDFSFNNPQAAGTSQPIYIGPQAASTPTLAPFVGQTLVPIATPLAFNGIDPSAMQYFNGYFQAMGFQPVAGLSGTSSKGGMVASTEDTLTPGKSIAVELVRGDLALAAYGTVTWRDGEKIYAFGHPFFAPGGAGISELPMAEAKVLTVVPSIMNSFKLATSEKMVGTIQQDRATGIYGKLGVAPKMIPLTISVTTSRGKKETYHMEVVSDNNLTPLLVQVSTLGSIIATERSLGDLTINMDGNIRVKNQSPITFSNSFSAANAFVSAVLYASYPVAALYGSGFNFDMEGIEINLKSADRRASGALTRLSIDRTEVKRGETVNIQAFARNERGETYVEKIPLTIPVDAPLRQLNITVGDGSIMSGLDRRNIIDSNPTDLAALVKAMNNLPKNDRLYVKLYYSDSGAVINNQEMPSLPPSMLAALDSNRTTGSYLPLPIATVMNRELSPAQFLISGQQTITIKIVQ